MHLEGLAKTKNVIKPVGCEVPSNAILAILAILAGKFSRQASQKIKSSSCKGHKKPQELRRNTQ
jgi:hypothetical protein